MKQTENGWVEKDLEELIEIRKLDREADKCDVLAKTHPA